jgi:hypothetical protein
MLKTCLTSLRALVLPPWYLRTPLKQFQILIGESNFPLINLSSQSHHARLRGHVQSYQWTFVWKHHVIVKNTYRAV